MVKRINQTGFSLVEVMIALAIFAVFSVSIIATQSNNIVQSSQMAEDLIMHNLAEMKMSEALLGKREFTNVTENEIDTGQIEIEGYTEYKFKIEYKKNEFPDFAQIMGQTEEESNANQDQNAAVKKQIFNKLKTQMENLLWQIRVTIIHPQGSEYSLNSWVTRGNAKIELNF